MLYPCCTPTYLPTSRARPQVCRNDILNFGRMHFFFPDSRLALDLNTDKTLKVCVAGRAGGRAGAGESRGECVSVGGRERAGGRERGQGECVCVATVVWQLGQDTQGASLKAAGGAHVCAGSHGLLLLLQERRSCKELQRRVLREPNPLARPRRCPA